MFTRSPSGILNYGVFSGADIVVYLEGGDVTGCFSTEESDDILYWKGIFNHFMSNHRYKFKALGSKSNLISHANILLRMESAGFFFVMDRDYDFFYGLCIGDPRVLYTFGYSWENDLFHPRVFFDALCVAMRIGSLPKLLRQEVVECYKYFNKSMMSAVKADIIFHGAGVPVIAKNNTGGGMLNVRNHVPVVSKRVVKDSIRSAAKLRKPGKMVPCRPFRINALRYCYGHLLFRYFSVAFSHFVKRSTGRSVGSDHVLDLLVLTLRQRPDLYLRGRIYRYFSDAFRRFYLYRLMRSLGSGVCGEA